jgi:hypothetical protein
LANSEERARPPGRLASSRAPWRLAGDAHERGTARYDLAAVVDRVEVEPQRDTETLVQGLVSRPARVVAPTSVKGRTSTEMLSANMPFARHDVDAKFLDGGYRASSTVRSGDGSRR